MCFLVMSSCSHDKLTGLNCSKAPGFWMVTRTSTCVFCCVCHAVDNSVICVGSTLKQAIVSFGATQSIDK